MQTAVSLYRGDFLADFYLDDSNEFEEWAQVTRQHYRRHVLDALDSLTTIAARRAACSWNSWACPPPPKPPGSMKESSPTNCASTSHPFLVCAVTWYIAQMTPGTHPLEELELALWPIAVNAPSSLVEPMQKDSRGMLRTIRRILPEGEGAQLLLVIDQFEELFTMTDAARRTQFLESLYTAVAAARSPLRVVVTLRADFYDRPLQYPPLADLFKQHTELVLALNRDELIWAVQEPAQRLGIGFEDGLLADIVADMESQPGALPLLQYALTELFNARHDRQMTRRVYATIGGVPGALARRADEIFHALSPQQQAAARQMFLRLVTPGEEGSAPDTRRRVRLSELEGLMLMDNQSLVIVEENQLPLTDYRSPITDFGSARLLTFDRDPVTREPTVEVAHEALLHRWERLRGWIAQSRADIRQQRQLAGLAAEWESHNRDDGFLLQGARLRQFEAWQQQNMLALGDGCE